MVCVSIHEGSHSTHASPPNTNTTYCSQSPQIFKNCINIVSLIVPKGNILAFRNSATSEVESKERNIMSEYAFDAISSVFL